MKRKMPEGRKFVKGVSGNPLGGKLHNPELRAIKRLTAPQVAEIGALIVQGNLAELKKIGKDPNATVLQTMMAAVAIKTIQKGDQGALDVLLNRLVGKVPTQVELTGAGGGPLKTVVGPMSREDQEAEIKRLDNLAGSAGED